MKILFLDDDQNRFDQLQSNLPQCFLHWVRDCYEMMEALRNDSYDVIMLDHDLGDHLPSDRAKSVGDGAIAAKLLAESRLLLGDSKTIIIHSLNPIGVANMLSHMKHADHLTVYVVPGAWEKAEYTLKHGLKFNT